MMANSDCEGWIFLSHPHTNNGLFFQWKCQSAMRLGLDSNLIFFLNTNLDVLHLSEVLIWFDSLRPSQQFFSYLGMGLPGKNQY